MSDKMVKMLATWFYIGDLRIGPGTAASAVGALIAIICSANLLFYILVAAVITAIGFKVSGRAEEMAGTKDPGFIVIDEVAGIMVALFLLPLTPAVLISAFFLFRAFDMFKIYPVNKFEEMEGAKGIMVDDLIAGLYTNIVMQFAIRVAGII